MKRTGEKLIGCYVKIKISRADYMNALRVKDLEYSGVKERADNSLAKKGDVVSGYGWKEVEDCIKLS